MNICHSYRNVSTFRAWQNKKGRLWISCLYALMMAWDDFETPKSFMFLSFGLHVIGYMCLFFLTTTLQNSSREENNPSDQFPVHGLVPLFVLNWRAHWAAEQGLHSRWISQKSFYWDQAVFWHLSNLCYIIFLEWSCMQLHHYSLLPALHLTACCPLAQMLTCSKCFVAYCCSFFFSINKERLLTLLTRHFKQGCGNSELQLHKCLLGKLFFNLWIHVAQSRDVAVLGF